MDNKYIIIAAIISVIGTFFEPVMKKKHKEPIESLITHEAELCVDSLRNVNDSLIEALRMENRVLVELNSRLRNKNTKSYRTKNGKKVYR
tara:strand:+ start:410 stop:679 length:270 start_codon:yes stop_codon:yes gene_type:complete